MFWKNCYNPFAKALFLTILLCGSAQIATGQDPTAGDGWKDSATGLIWAIKDNGSDVNWTAARDYCDNLTLGGQSDWRLPTIDELETVYDRNQSKKYKAKGPIELGDASVWSGTSNNSGEVWNFYFTYGGRSLTRASGHSSYGRALCVRKAGE